MFGNINSITVVKNLTADYSNATVKIGQTKAEGVLKLITFYPIKKFKILTRDLKRHEPNYRI